jgi:hypothetical protein
MREGVDGMKWSLADENEVRKVEIIEVIHVKFLRGKGTADEPYREVDSYWSLEGEMLAERDFWSGKAQEEALGELDGKRVVGFTTGEE